MIMLVKQLNLFSFQDQQLVALYDDCTDTQTGHWWDAKLVARPNI